MDFINRFERTSSFNLTTFTVFLGVLIATAFIEANAQSKAERAQSGIVQETVYEQDYEKGKPSGKQIIVLVSKYDKVGRLVEEIEYKDGKPDVSTTMVYDADGKKIKEIEKNSSGKLVKTIEYKYENGLRTERTTFDANNQIKTKKYYKYEKTQ